MVESTAKVALPIGDQIAASSTHLLAKGDGAQRSSQTTNALTRLFARAGAGTAKELAYDQVQAALAALRNASKLARTVNPALTAVQAFVV